MILTDEPATPLAVSLKRLLPLVSPLVGIAQSLDVLVYSEDEPRVHQVSGLACRADEMFGFANSQHGGGSGANPVLARVAAIGEIVERYSATFVPDEFVFASYNSIGAGEHALDPMEFSLFAEWQYRQPDFHYIPFTRDTEISWVRGYLAPQLRPILVPAQMVYLPAPRAPGEPRIDYATSNGLAAHASFAEAALSSVLELAERDAFALCWHGQLSMPRIDTSTDPQLSAFIERYLAPAGLRFTVMDYSVFGGVPVAFAIARGGDYLGVGSAAGLNMPNAIQRALLEAASSRRWARRQHQQDPDRVFADDHSDLREFADHVAFYTQPDRQWWLDFLDASPDLVAISELDLAGDTPAQSVRNVTAALASRGLAVTLTDVTSPDVAEAGLSVVKALSPQLRPLDVGMRSRHLGPGRLYEEPARWLGSTQPLTAEQLNPHPHPFP